MTLRLTRSERTVMVLLANGRTQTSIADEQGLKAKSINKHVENVRKKVGARTTVHAVALCLAHGLVDGSEVVEQ